MKIALTKTESRLNRYTSWLEKFNIEYELLDHDCPEGEINKLDECSGLVLSGGIDIYPELYCDWDTVETKGTYSPDRDGFELNVLEKSIDMKLPILGICRGLQLMNVFFRGSLIFDIEEIRNVDHRKISLNEDRMHDIRVFKDTLLYDIVKSEKVHVNSSHHQSIDRLGEGLMINSKSDDGIVEGIEYSEKNGKPFFLGVQWHPERLGGENEAVSKNIFDKFILECENFA